MWRLRFRSLLFAGGLSALIAVAGCATIRGIDRQQMAEKAVREGFQQHYLSAPPFVLTVWQRSTAPAESLVVYIEGDGYAWASRNVPSDDPTPHHPLAFFLACEDQSANVLYVSRPGQFPGSGAVPVDQAYWTSKRYSEEVVLSLNAAIDEVKASSGSKTVSLVGFSGGAAVAVLVAARRKDVTALRTVAGNLASHLFVRAHHVSALTGSLDPLAVATRVKGIPQRHFIGGKDTIVTRRIAEAFLDAIGDPSRQRLTVVDDAGHLNGWKDHWRELLGVPLN